MLFILSLPIVIIFVIFFLWDTGSGSSADRIDESSDVIYYHHPHCRHENQDSYEKKQHDLEEVSYDPYDEKEYNNYYMDTYQDAMEGSEEAIQEMYDEFGEDWEGEY